MRFLALSLVLLLPVSLHSESIYGLSEASKNDILKSLNEVESWLQTLKKSLQDSEERSKTLSQELAQVKLDLEQVTNDLQLVRENLKKSEDSLELSQSLLAKALKALTESEQSLKAYGFWEMIKGFLAGAGITWLIMVLVG